MPAKMSNLEKQRFDKLEKIRALGRDPWGQRFDDHQPIADVRPECPEESGEAGPKVRVAGRVMAKRKAGKLRFFGIKDQTGTIQLLFSRGDLAEEQWELMGQLDYGDLVGIDGHLQRTNTGEVSVLVHELTILTKSMAPPPEKHHGIEDVETLLRQRSLDLIYTEGVLERMLTRSAIIDSIRGTLRDHGFHEVETPVLHAIAGGAAARPFETHHNALDIPLFLRIALELHLKRLMVGGIERVYEIGRVFRNEGIDATHNPEFTMLEAYRAYCDYETMMDLTEAIVSNAAALDRNRDYVVVESAGDTSLREGGLVTRPQAEAANAALDDDKTPAAFVDRPLGTHEVVWTDMSIDFAPPWPREKYHDLFREHVGIDPADEAAVRAKGREVIPAEKVDVEKAHIDVVVSELFEEFVEPNLVGPVFVIDYPASICPLTKRKQNDETIAERFELFVHGMELANAYTELNDPYLQQELFETQLEGLAEEESMAKMDHEFIGALKIGMPPAGGLGIGIDRLVMLLTNSQSIRDVIFFPLLRPEQPR